MLLRRNWQLVTNGKLFFMNFVQKLTRSLKSTGMYLKWQSARFACERYGDRCPASPKDFWGFDNSGLYLLMMGRIWQLVTNRKPIFHELCWEASSKRNHYGNVAQRVERTLSMREVRGSMPRISKTYFRIRRFCFLFGAIGKELTTRYKWKTVFHEFCSEANSKLEEYGDVSQMV